MKRVNESLTAPFERKILPGIASRLPLFVTPDRLTAVALLSALLAGIFYLYVPENWTLLLWINLLIFIHWLTDSLDGQVARTRRIERPKYGHYVDHMLDALSATLILGGITSSSITFTASWLWMLIAFLLLITHTHLASTVFGEFHLSFGAVGPTEARMALVLINFIIFFFGNPIVSFEPIPATLMDLIGAVGAFGLFTMLLVQVGRTTLILRKNGR